MGASGPERRWVSCWKLLYLVHVPAALAWWWLLPGGFPWWHPRFFANQLGPWLMVAGCLAALVAAQRRTAAEGAAALALCGFWLAVTVGGLALFPLSAVRLLAPGLAWTGLLGTVWGLRFRRWPRLAELLAALPGVLAALALVWSQRAPDPDTRPLDPPSAVPDNGQTVDARLRIGPHVSVYADDGAVQMRIGGPQGLDIHLGPLLSFFDGSPDRCWTSLAPERVQQGRLEPLGARLYEHSVELSWTGDARRELRVAESAGLVTVDARTWLQEDVYSHLNALCELQVGGYQRLFLEFSPCPGQRIEVLPADYPVGRPARHACLTEGGEFQVFEASSGEKGPFRLLAQGRLARTDTLTIRFYDGDRPVGRLELLDWAAQAGTQLSPSAGWGVPVNAIEFQRISDRPSSPSQIFISLASTSVGRGWDAVGHRAGGYRNRMVWE